jgi:DNA-binding XRE family transcriptional regulator
MKKINLNKIEKKRKEIGIPRAELARRISMNPDTLNKFLKSGKKLNDHLIVVQKLCRELDIDFELLYI